MFVYIKYDKLKNVSKIQLTAIHFDIYKLLYIITFI